MIRHSSIRNASLTPSIAFLSITNGSVNTHTHSMYDASLLSILFVMFKVFWIETPSSWLLSYDISSHSQHNSMICWLILLCTIHSSVLESAFSPAFLPRSLFSDESKHGPWMCALQLQYDCLRTLQGSEYRKSCSCSYFQVQCQSDGIWKIIRFRWGDDLQSSWWDSCPFKKRKRWEFDSPVSCEDTEKEQSFPSQGGLSAGLDNAGLLSQTSNLENCEKMNFYCLSHPIYGILSRQPEQLETRTFYITIMLLILC